MESHESAHEVQDVMLKVFQYNKGLIDLEELKKEIHKRASNSKYKVMYQPWIKGLDFLECYQTKLALLQDLCSGTMQIIIESLTSKLSNRMPKLSFILDVKSTDTVEVVKTKIREIKGTPLDEQRLFLNGNQLKDSQTMKECNIQNGTLIRLERHFQISSIGLGGKRSFFEVDASDTIEIVKRCRMSDGISPDENRLIFRGQRLKNELTVSDYNLQPGDQLQVVLRLRSS